MSLPSFNSLHCKLAKVALYTAVSRKVVLQTGKLLMDNGGYGCLSEPQGVSTWWKETAQATKLNVWVINLNQF